LIDALIDRLHSTLANAPDDGALLAAIVRGLSAAVHSPSVRQAVKTLLESPQGQDVEVLAAIAGRAWDGLADADLLQAYLLRLADSGHGQPVFEHCVTDLLALPGLAPRLRRALRSPNQSPSVRRAFARMTGDGESPGRE